MNSGYLRYRVLWPLVPAMAMVMIDFTIVSISATTIQADLHLSSTGTQWIVTAYALSTAAFIALGGRLGDIIGHKRIVVIGILVFTTSSLLCGLTPDGSASEPWIIIFRALQGLGGALMIPSITVLVLNSFPPDERGKGLSIFFIVAGLFTAIGPIAGSYLTEFWTWRAIFWINVPVALISLIEMRRVTIPDQTHPAKIDWAGAAILVGGMGLLVLGIQESSVWGWTSIATIGSIVAGLLLLAFFVRFERNVDQPLIDIRDLSESRPFMVDNLLTGLLFFPWLAIFFFGSMYFQVAVGQKPTQAGFSILTMFYSFFIASRVGGGLMDKKGAKHPVCLGLAAGAGGMALWASEMPKLSHPSTLAGMLLTGAGFGLAMSALNTDALNRVPDKIRGQASGIIQSSRNFGSALGMAVMGSVVISVSNDHTTAGASQGFADATQAAFYVGAGVMAVGYLIAHFFMVSGIQADIE